MITIMVLSLLFLALASAVGFAIISLTDSTTKNFKAQSDVDQMNRWHSVVSNSLRPYGESQKLVAPMSVNSGSYYSTLPNNIIGAIGLSSKNSKGKDIIYCPLSQDTIQPAETVTDNISFYEDTDSTIISYQAVTAEYENGIKYLLKHRDFESIDSSIDGNVLAILISPFSDEKIGCKDVQIDSSGKPVIYTSEGVPAGIVRIATKDEKNSSSINKPVHVNTVDYTSTTSFNALVGSYDAIQPSRFILDMHDKGESYELTSDLLISSSFPGNKDQFIINGSGSGTLIDASSPVTLKFNNMSVKLNNVSLGSNVSLEITNGLLEIDNQLSGTSLNLNNSDLNAYSSFQLTKSLTLINSNVKAYSSVDIAEGMVMKDSYFNNNDTTNITGHIYAENSNIKVSAALNVHEELNASGNFENPILLVGSTLHQGSNLTIYKRPSSNFHSLYLSGGSQYISNNGISSITSGASGNAPTSESVYIDSSSLFSLNNGSEFSTDIRHTSVFINNGKIHINDSMAVVFDSTTYYITMNGGSELALNNATVGSSNVTGTTINDKGATLISGGGDPTTLFGSASTVSIYGNQCWDRTKPIFNSLFSNSSGYSKANSNANKPFNSSVWKCNF